jgi:D-alanyl-D-alanine carboxypeptidase (penicillin-binding protein 5/6)
MAVMLAVIPFTAFAEPDDSASSDTSSVVTDSTIEKAPDVKYAEAAVLMDLDSGRLLYSKNPQEKLYPASTTKMMTAIIALETGNMSDTVTATYAALKDITLDDSHMGILIGEELTMEQLVNGMLVYSANDAANVIAIHLAGSVEAFAEKMNEKAAELGMKNTHFVNACGVHDDNHYTTAEDLAILGKYCMQNETFREIVKQPSYSMPATNKYAMERNLPSTNLFLSKTRSTAHYYQPCIGIKTGHTSQAGYCLVSAAEYNGISLLSVVMKCNNTNEQAGAYSYIDSKTLFEFGFNNYELKALAEPGTIVADTKVYEAKGNVRVSATVPDEVKALIPVNADAETDIEKDAQLPEQIDAPISKGDKIGTVTYSYDGKDIGKADLVAVNDVERNEIIHAVHISLGVITSPFFFIPVIIIIILIIIANHQRRKRERKRRIQQLKRNKQRRERNSDTGYRSPDRKASRTQIQGEEARGANSRYKDGK